MRAELKHATGQGRALVYVPGIDGTGELLLGTAQRLERHWRLLRLRYVPDGPDTYEEIATSIQQLLGKEGIPDAVLVAESFGVGVALRTALLMQERIRGLLLVNGFCWYRRRFRLAMSRGSAPLVRSGLFRLGRRLFGSVILLGSEATPDEHRAFHTQPGSVFDDAYRRRLAMIRRLDLRTALPSLMVPALLVASGRDRVVDSAPSARLMHELLPHSELRELPRSGHVVLPLAAHPWEDWLFRLEGRPTRLRD